jgi:tetratricopeptide (TPR) repeat protein
MGRVVDRLRGMLDGPSDARSGAAVFLVALVVRLAYLLEIHGAEVARVLVGDARSYDAWAREIARGDWIGHEVFYQAPLYPYFLAVVYALAGPSVLAVRLTQAAFGAISCALLALAAGRFFSRAIGLAAGLVLAFYGPVVFFTGVVHKMTLDLTFTTALLYALARAGAPGARRGSWLVVAGAALGCLSLTRENALAWVPVVLVWLAWRARADDTVVRRAFARSLGPFVAGLLLVLGPVAARNTALGGAPFLTTSQLGVNFYLGNNADADGLYTPLRFGHGSFAQERQDAVEIAERERGRALPPAEVSAFWLDRAWSWIADHPVAWLRLLGRKWMLVWGAHEVPDSDEPLVYEDASLVLRATSRLSFGVLVPLAAAGAFAGLIGRRRGALGAAELLLLALLLTSAASTAAFFVFARYRVPMIPSLVVLAVLGVVRLRALARDYPARRAALAAACGTCVLAAILSWLPRAGDPHPRATAQYNRAVTLEADGEPASAAAAYRAAVRDAPEFVEARVNLGSLLARAGDFEGAIGQVSAALAARPEDAAAHTIMANALLASGRLDEAEAHYRAALATDPELPSARAGLETLRDLRVGTP